MLKNKDDKQLKAGLYTGLLISSIILPIILTAAGYYLNGKFYPENMIPFAVILIWLLVRGDYFKKPKNPSDSNDGEVK
jgi:hypothetical protein